ncbi:MAG: glycosyltransferase family 4 protein [Prevotella sp.]|nr:glycosyltransferase family 4 protein [Prevotella sp.]
MSKIKIIHLAQCAGGVDCYLRMLFANMNSERYANVLVCSYDYERKDYDSLADKFIQIEMCNSLSLRKDILAIGRVRKIIKRIKPDIIYCHSSKAGGIGRLANIGTGIPIVYNPHGWAFCMSGSKAKSLIYLWIERMLALLTTKIITISNYEKLIAVEKHIAKAGKIKTIFNGIDMTAVERQIVDSNVSRARLGIPDDACLIGMAGRISKQKAPDIFVKMARKVIERIPNAWFMIVGDGDERSGIERLIIDFGLSNRFIITGWVDSPLSYVNMFDIAVLLSRWEGFGLVLAEYMKLGKPIVATEIDAIPDLITEHENGLLVSVDNYEQSADAVLEIYENEELKNEMIRKGKMRADALFDIKRTAKEHERLFEKLLIGGGRM